MQDARLEKIRAKLKRVNKVDAQLDELDRRIHEPCDFSPEGLYRMVDTILFSQNSSYTKAMAQTLHVFSNGVVVEEKLGLLTEKGDLVAEIEEGIAECERDLRI